MRPTWSASLCDSTSYQRRSRPNDLSPAVRAADKTLHSPIKQSLSVPVMKGLKWLCFSALFGKLFHPAQQRPSVLFNRFTLSGSAASLWPHSTSPSVRPIIFPPHIPASYLSCRCQSDPSVHLSSCPWPFLASSLPDRLVAGRSAVGGGRQPCCG